MSAVLSNSYFAILITLHRNFIPQTPDFPRPKPPPSSQSLSHCVDAARSVIHIAATQRTLVPPSHHLAVTCQYLWSSAVILLLCELQARERVVVDAVGSSVESCRRSLQALEPVWPGSRKLKELLNDVEARAKDVVVATMVPPTTKKRKASAETAPHGKRTVTSQAQASHRPYHTARSDSGGWQYQLMPGGGQQLKRTGSEPRYQTSHTRTNSREDDSTAPQWQLPTANITSEVQIVQPIDMGFDIGGVDFSGLDMLQGFSGTDVASFWDALNIDSTVSLQSEVPNQTAVPLHNVLTTGSVPSPNGWPYSLTPSAQDSSGLNADFWSQVAGGSFDWAADPAVPFNI